jgi:hypothetical protein
MITKIISGGQSGADQAALDVAIEEGIPYGGWIPKGRKTEAGRLPDKYLLKEMPTEDYPERTEQNAIESDGTMIISHGELTGGSQYTRKMAKKHSRPSIHIDLEVINGFRAAQTITTWIAHHRIKVLNVAGPRASKDPKIYEAVKKVLKAVLHLDQVQTYMPDPERLHPPRTVEEAVEYLISNLPLKDKTMIAKMPEDELHYLHNTLGQYIRNNFGLWAENRSLMQSCCLRSSESLSKDECSAFIIKELWKRLQSSHKMRAVQ